uniref:Uncharacterized protein n=1 Tax=Globisporangium ultimum (strain ATCC 200006 / CBS 805.95 / DAOM BR144) TaxID=431595 RepID=K3WZA7_GLOUD
MDAKEQEDAAHAVEDDDEEEVGGSNGGTDSVNCVRDAAPPGGAVFDGVAGHDIEHQQPPKRIQLVLSPRRCISKELLEQMPMLSVSTRYHEVTISKPFGVFHLMQLIEKSIQVGALFTPKLYVPKEIWQQDRVRLAGVPLKIEAFQQLKQGLEKTSMALPLSSDAAKATFIKELDVLLEYARALRLNLARSFPFLPADKANQVQPNPKVEQAAPSPQGAGVAIGKLTNLAYGFGRMVKKQAIAAVERVGAAQSVTISFDELEEYAATLCSFFNSTRSIENLLGLSVDADGGQEQVNEHKTPSPNLDPIALEKLKELAIFLDEVVIELVMRDTHSLLESYLKRATRSFGEFIVENAIMKHHSSISA